MSELVINLPDDLEERARNAGLLSDSAIQALPEDAMRRKAGRQPRTAVESIHAADSTDVDGRDRHGGKGGVGGDRGGAREVK
jgi:hypothetical protein